MENIIKGLTILDVYNGRLQVSLDLIKLEDFEIKKILKDDYKNLEECGWKLITKRDTGELIRASYDTSKNL